MRVKHLPIPSTLQQISARTVATCFGLYLLNLLAAVPLSALSSMYRVNPQGNRFTTGTLLIVIGLATAWQWRRKTPALLLIPLLYTLVMLAANSGHNLSFLLAASALALLRQGKERMQSTITTLPPVLIAFLQLVQFDSLTPLGLLTLLTPALAWLPWTRWPHLHQHLLLISPALTVLSGGLLPFHQP